MSSSERWVRGDDTLSLRGVGKLLPFRGVESIGLSVELVVDGNNGRERMEESLERAGRDIVLF